MMQIKTSQKRLQQRFFIEFKRKIKKQRASMP
jgi:hypothetical protein